MILKSVFIDLNRDEFSSEEAYSFKKKTRHVLNFIERDCLKKIKFKNNSFRRIVIVLCKKKDSRVFVNSLKILGYEIPFNQKEYEECTEEKLAEYFLKILIKSLNELKDKFDLPYQQILESIHKFRALDYKNKWTHKKKLNRELGLTFFLDCEMSVDEFNLFLRIKNKTEQILNRKLLTLEPDEIAFEYRFKDIIFKDDKLIITSKMSENLLEEEISNIIIT